MRLSTLDGLFAAQYVTLASGPLLTAFLLALGASSLQVGLVAALLLVGNLLQPAGAEVIRRRGGWRRPIALGAALTEVLLWSVSVAAVIWLPTPTALLLVLGVLALQQVPAAFVGVAWTSWISDLIPPPLRGRYFGRRNVITNGFAAVTALVAGLLLQASPSPLPGFLLAIGLGVAARFISIYFLSRHPEPRPAKSLGGGFWSQLAPPLRHAGYRRYVVYNAAMGFGVQLASPFFVVYTIQEAGLGTGIVMVQTALSTAANLIGQRIWGPLSDRYGERQVLRVVGLGIALQPLWWLAAGPSVGGQVLILALGMVGGFLWGGQTLASGNLMMRLAPETGKTAFFAVQAALAGLSGALGPLTGGVLAAVVVSGDLGPWVPATLKVVFVVSAAARLGGWLLLRRVPEPAIRPRLEMVQLLRTTARTLNPAQGFSPLLQVFTVATEAPRRLVRKGRSMRRRRMDSQH